MEEVKKLFKWEGFKKEIPWILFCIGILIAGYGYYDIKTRYNKFLNDPCTGRCVWDCNIDEVIENLQKEYPGTTINCDYEVKKCFISGVAGIVPDFQVDMDTIGKSENNETK